MAILAGVAFLLLGSAGSGFDPIAQAAALSARAPGFRMHMSLQVSTPVLGAAMTSQTNGVVDLRDGASSMSMVMQLPATPQVTQALGGDTLTIDMVTEHGAVYFKFPPAVAAKLPYDKPWLELNLSQLFDSAGLSGLTSVMNNPLSSDPTSQLAYLRATSGAVVNDGSEVIDGVATTHYAANIDFSRVANVVPPAERAATSQTMSKLEALIHADQEPVQVWIDHGHRVRRLSMTLNYRLGAVPMALSLTEDLSDYGPQPEPAAPPADQVQAISSISGLGG